MSRGTNFDGRMNEWMDGRMNGWMNGWMDGWTDERTVHFVFPDLPEHTTTRGASGPNIRATVQYLFYMDRVWLCSCTVYNIYKLAFE